MHENPVTSPFVIASQVFTQSLSCFKKIWKNIIQQQKYDQESRPSGLSRIAPQ